MNLILRPSNSFQNDLLEHGTNVITLFYGCNSLMMVIGECLLLADLSSLIQCLWIKPGACLRVKHMKGRITVLVANNRLSWRGLPWTKHSSLLQAFVSEGCKKSYNTGPRSEPPAKPDYIRRRHQAEND